MIKISPLGIEESKDTCLVECVTGRSQLTSTIGRSRIGCRRNGEKHEQTIHHGRIFSHPRYTDKHWEKKK
jgi:hypothetical protein